MILLSLVLVLLSLGLLIAGLAGASQTLVWASIASSVVAGVCLVLAALQRRGLPGAGERTEPADAPAESTTSGADLASAGPPAQARTPVAEAATEVIPAQAPAGDLDEDYPDPPDEPPEEDVSAPDALRVVDTGVDVLVVDGRPRYHLEDCPHLAGREVIPLPVQEAREDGFTPCSLCKPDATLAARARGAAAERAATAGLSEPDPPAAAPGKDGRRQG